MKPRRIAAVVAVTLMVATAIVGLPRLARTSSFFAIERVEVDGVTYLDADAVVRHLGLTAAASILDPVGPHETAVRSLPGVVGAQVTRRFPGTLVVRVNEAVPIALTPGVDRLVMVDHHGAILPFDPARAAVSLPVIDPSPAAATLLAHIMLVDPEWYAAIDSAADVRGDVVIESAGQRVRLRPQATRETLRSVMLVRDYLSQHNVAWREIDGRFAARVFVHRSRA
ncbi:MAG: FtsQ-type POTRA domain-containing protein [Gemmatimonadales bacterium]